MNITEANATNILLRHTLGLPPLPTEEQALAAAEQLADKAHKTLSAGLTAADVTRAWPETLFCPAQEQGATA